MIILGIECSAAPASVAVYNGEKILAYGFTNIKVTHSASLLPTVKNMLDAARLDINDIDGFCVSSGPGSFTGVRIGIAAIKGLAAPNDKPCVAVSSLNAMAVPFINNDCVVCCVMDARCGQVYNALFKAEGGSITRLCPDRAIAVSDLAKELENFAGQKIIITGDGTDMFYSQLNGVPAQKAQISLRYQNATGVVCLAYQSFLNGETVSQSELLPTYLRLPQAERELKKKEEKTK